MIAVAMLVIGVAVAGSGTSFRITDEALNAGGHPAPKLTSPSYRVTLDALGDAVSATGGTSANYRVDGGFVSGYRPPGEVLSLRMAADRRTLDWAPERSVGSYALYRGGLAELAGNGSGACRQSPLTSTSAVDAEAPAARTGFFYLVTARNRIAEEGTKGKRSDGSERARGTPCP